MDGHDFAGLALPRPKATHQATTFDRRTRGKTVAVPRGSRVTVAEASGTGYVAQLWMTFPGWFWQHWAPDRPVDQSILKTLIVRITFDDADAPQVAAPVADLFAQGLGEMASFTSQYVGMSSGGFYLSFPMPFRKGFKIEIENLDETIDTDVFMNVLWQEVDAWTEVPPTFHVQFRTGANDGSEPLLVAEAKGRGRYVGCALACQGVDRNYLSFLEAPEHVYFAGEKEPRIVGTGLEDYFLGGWYFREGTFCGPRHGVPVKDTLRSAVAMYRIHDHDAIWFEDGLRFAFENPWEPERLRPFTYSTVGYLYLDESQSSPAVPPRESLLCFSRVKDTDRLSVP